MRGKITQAIVLLTSVAALSFPIISQAAIQLGAAGTYAVLAGAAITNTGPTSITAGDVGVSPGSSVTGFPPGIIAGSLHSGDASAVAAQLALASAYNNAAGLSFSQVLTGQNVGGLTLTPGVYRFADSAQLTGMLKLDSQGNPNAEFVFQIGSTLTTASQSSVVSINGGTGSLVYWQVGSSAVLGTQTAFEGHILANASITLNTGAAISTGSALAMNGAVTLDTNSINNPLPVVTPVPEPSTVAFYGIGGALLAYVFAMKRRGDRKGASPYQPAFSNGSLA